MDATSASPARTLSSNDRPRTQSDKSSSEKHEFKTIKEYEEEYQNRPFSEKFRWWRLRKWINFQLSLQALLLCPNPLRTTVWLLWPFPWHFIIPPQLPPRELILPKNRHLIVDRKDTETDYNRLRKIPPFVWRDTPLRVLYRLYEATLTHDYYEMKEETRYLFNQQPGWKLKDIRDPKDPNVERQAILAGIVETLVKSFNAKLDLGFRRAITEEYPLMILTFKQDPKPPYEEPPAWCASVPPLEEDFHLSSGHVVKPYQTFIKKNTVVGIGQIWNLLNF